MTAEANLPDPEQPPDEDYPQIFIRQVVQSTSATWRGMDTNALIIDQERLDRALHVLSFALMLKEAWPATRKLLLWMAPLMEKMGQRDSWLLYLEKGVELSRRIEDKAAEAELTLQIGLLYQLRSKLAQAAAAYQASAHCFAETADPHNQARALNQQAYVAWLQRWHEEAIRLSDLALSLLPPDDVRRATGYVVRGWVAFDRQELDIALSHFTDALTLWQAHGDQRQIARRLRNVANVLRLQKRYTEAIAFYEESIALFDELRDPFEHAVSQMNLGILYWANDELIKAKSLFEMAQLVFHQVQDILHLAMLYNNLGMVERALHDWKAAHQAFERSTTFWQQLNNISEMVNTLGEWGMTYYAEGRLQEAIGLFQQALVYLQQMKADPRFAEQQQEITTYLNQAIRAAASTTNK